ncbi:MAG: bifunctional 5,10-methylenetetrahydrofolate dehydrogenase/5,10-methenyltetrahydrofolate cyclohydrolase [Chloroflexota bacterium]|nr:bifunctional 5,10-methylenetetrahydrofolate dehydrogenase/5,10-methenyltetrahydrofolate cyclohydrolase [Chloroflexota bacterium]
MILRGSELAAHIRVTVKLAIDRRLEAGSPAPRVTIVLAAEASAAHIYIASVEKSFANVGIQSHRMVMPEGATTLDLVAAIEALAADSTVQGILLPTPLPKGHSLLAAQDALPPEKDIEGISSPNIGRLALGQPRSIPATPLGGIELLRHYSIQLEGKRAVVIGRSSVVGWPMATLLMQANATVTVCHSRTPDMGEVTRQAEILVAAAGRPKLVTADMVRPGAVVVDFGVNVTEDGMCGDVDFDGVAEVASAITPVPGGTGPVTAAVLVRNVLEAAERANGPAPGAVG